MLDLLECDRYQAALERPCSFKMKSFTTPSGDLIAGFQITEDVGQRTGRQLQVTAAARVLRHSWRTDAIDEVAKRLGQRIANASKGRKTFGSTAFNRCRVRKAPVDSLGVAGKDGTAFVRVIADGDHVVEVLAIEFLNVLGAVARHVDSQLRHHSDRLRANGARLRSCRKDLKPVFAKRTQEAFRHLASCRVSGAENEHPPLQVHRGPLDTAV